MFNRLLLISGITLACVAMALYLATIARAADVVNAKMDASMSTGLDYPNFYVPLTAQLSGRVIGKRLFVGRFGGKDEVLFEGMLAAEQAAELKSVVLQTSHFPADVKGSPISLETVGQVEWLRSQPGSRKILILLTDGIEQAPPNLRLLPPGSAKGITALILFPRMPAPKAAEVLRLAGATVTVARTPAEAAAALGLALSGTTPARRAANTAALGLFGVGLLVALLGVIRVSRIQHEEPAVQQSPVETPREEPKRLPVLRPLQVLLTARAGRVGEEPELKAERRLTVKQGGLIIARGPAEDADLELPVDMLGEATEVLIELQPESLSRVRVTNLGSAVVITRRGPLGLGQAAVVPAGDGLMLGPEVEVTLELKAA